jgi:hypothetical protein
MPEPFTVQKWRASDGSLHDTEAEALDHEARTQIGRRADAVLARIRVMKNNPHHLLPGCDIGFLRETTSDRRERDGFNAGCRAAIEAAIRAGLIKGEG